MDLICRHSTIAGTPTLMISGEVDLSTIPQLYGELLRLVTDAGPRLVLVDLDGLSVLDDTGLGVLLGAAGRAREQGGEMELVATSSRLIERFERTGLARAITVRDRLTPAGDARPGT